MGEAAESACHELLLRLAGRLPDRQLWRFRDWLASGALPELSHMLPLTLLRERLGLTPAEMRLLDAALRPYGADIGLLSSIREVDESPEVPYSFSADSLDPNSLGDSRAVLLGALLRGRASVGEVRTCWRRGISGGGAKRILLAMVGTDWVAMTGELQRVQRALGERDPCVEVLALHRDVPPYHRAALAASELVCVGGLDRRDQLVLN